MAYIYKITNTINQKVYIGKTLSTPEKRFMEHIKVYERPRCEKRPLYSAFKKYGIKNFVLETIEECSEEIINEREEYWIQYYNSYHYGYNATYGGDGKRYADYDLIFTLYNKGKNIREIQELTKYNKKTVTTALDSKGISAEDRKKRGFQSISKPVVMLDKNTLEELRVFSSIAEAEKFLGKEGHITDVCKGKRKTSNGYSWKYLNE
jgi:group I intron endonuclease